LSDSAGTVIAESRAKVNQRGGFVVKKVVLADDCPVLRAGLRSVLEGSGEFAVEAEVDNPSALLRTAREIKPDIIVVDAVLARDSSLTVIEELRSDVPQSSVLVFSGRDEARAVRRALRAGAVGYLLKSGSTDEILGAARLIASGKSYLSPDISDHLVNAIIEEDESETALSGLTRRERDEQARHSQDLEVGAFRVRSGCARPLVASPQTSCATDSSGAPRR
jgi:DNA-binding NarL/FixJ family response regulator